MQIDNKQYDPELHDQYHAISVKQPFAQDLVTKCREDEHGTYAVKEVEVRNRQTTYRGDLLVCASKTPELKGYLAGVTLGFVELYECKPVRNFTQEDWDKTRIPREKRKEIKRGYGWFFRNPRRVIEMPINGRLGIYKLTTPKGDITEYPRIVIYDK